MFLFNENFASGKSGEMELLESTSAGYRMPKARIKTVLQTLNEVNKNKRIYPGYILERALKEIKPLFKSRSLLGELDHPVVSGNDEADSYRHFVVLYEKASHIIEDMYVDGNTLYGIVETSLTEPGFKMAGLIMDRVPVGFSLRAMGESKVRQDGVTEVTAPFTVITYDCVSNPSHAKARMVEVVSENFSKFRENAVPDIYLEHDIVCDRSDILNNMMGIKPVTSLEQIVESLEKKIKGTTNRLIEAKQKPTPRVHQEPIEPLKREPVVQYPAQTKSSVESEIDEMVKGYLNDTPQYQTPDVINFLDEYINAGAPVEDIFDKYLKS